MSGYTDFLLGIISLFLYSLSYDLLYFNVNSEKWNQMQKHNGFYNQQGYELLHNYANRITVGNDEKHYTYMSEYTC